MPARPDEVSARTVLLALADLAPSRTDSRPTVGSIPLDWFHWLPVGAVSLLADAWRPPASEESIGRTAVRVLVTGDPYARSVVELEPVLAERLAAVDQIRTSTHSLRVGWLFVAGSVPDADGTRRRVFQPLVSRPVQVHRSSVLSPRGLIPAGDTTVTDLVADADLRGRLEATVEVGGGALDEVGYGTAVPAPFLARLTHLADFARRTAAAAGLAATELVAAGEAPSRLMEQDPPVIVAGVAVYAVVAPSGESGRATTLRWWADHAESATAWHALYRPGDEDRPGSPGPDADAIAADADPEPADPVPLAATGLDPVSPFPLTGAQRQVVRSSRRRTITVVTGAPGTGKSHTITAVATDALARGETVLVAARSEAGVDALIELFERAPGPQPLVFGSSARLAELAARLAEGQLPTVGSQVREGARQRLDDVVAERDTGYAEILAQLEAEQLSEAVPAALSEDRYRWPMLYDPDVDLAEVGAQLAVAAQAGGRWWERWRQRRAENHLDAFCGARTVADRRRFTAAYHRARAARAASELVAAGGLDLAGRWEQLGALDDAVRQACAHWVAAEAGRSDRLTRRVREAIAVLATALRSGRAARRELLARVPTVVTEAFPLWVGTVGDIEDLLPRHPAAFDLVLLDEAASMDQTSAAPALLRARRAVIIGDPNQLRHVSFLSDDRRRQVLDARGITAEDPVAAKLDVRRNSAFDVAAGVSSVINLDEHFRGWPHLVDFVARRLYRGQVHVATRSPATQSVDCIEVVRLDGTRDEQAVVAVEVNEVVRRVRQMAADGATSVGVVSPFRAQAEALEAAMLDAFHADELEALGLRVGTVHGFQGVERDLVVVSLGVGTNGARAWSFVEDPHLFAVMVTRARRKLVMVTGAAPPPDGLTAGYLAHADSPPGPPPAVGSPSPWTEEIGADLRREGVPVVVGYPTGRHVVDLCVGDEDRFVAVTTVVHPDGPVAHIDRQLALRRGGWSQRDAFSTRWAERRGELLVELDRYGSPG